MPITQERQTMQDLRAAGFTQQQAEVLAEKLEATAQATAQDLKSFIVAELDKRFSAMEKILDRRFSELELKVERALRLQLTTVLTVFVGPLGLAVAIIKLFPNAH